MTARLFMSLVAMSFLWVGSQIPLYLFGGVIADIYADIGGVDRWVWFAIGYLIPNAALCPFVGALSDLFGRRYLALFGQVLLIVGPIVTSTANTMNVAIGKFFPYDMRLFLTPSRRSSHLRHRCRLERVDCPCGNWRIGSDCKTITIRWFNCLDHSSIRSLCGLRSAYYGCC